MFDFSGFGYSFGEWAMSDINDLFEDVYEVLKVIWKDLPLIIVAHSMGGGIMLSFIKLNPDLKIIGLILSNPFIDFHKSHGILECYKYIIELFPKKMLGLIYNPPVDPF